jgi:Leucine-rich repeat (LRR) protein
LEGTIPPEIENLVNLSEYSVPVNNMHGTIPTELGNLVNLRYLWLNGNSFEGSVPNGVGNMSQLLYLRIDNNQFTDLPDISADSVLYETQIQNNRFTFEDIEPNISAGGFIYSPQDSIGDKQDVTIPQDSSHVLSVSVDGTANKYQWKKDGIVIEEATDSSYIIVGATSDDEGSYVCDISNTIATELTLYSRAINVTVSGATGIESQSTQILKIFSLNQNYPNPFNPKTIINYELPITDVIDLSIFNILGKKVATIVSKKQSAGSYRVSWDASGFSSGVYYYKLTTSSGFTQSHKMVFLK